MNGKPDPDFEISDAELTAVAILRFLKDHPDWKLHFIPASRIWLDQTDFWEVCDQSGNFVQADRLDELAEKLWEPK